MKKVVVIGPESTGKSYLCQQLAAHYNTTWCPEYARTYLEENGTAYNYSDVEKIARGQLQLEALTKASAANGVYFVDTDMYVMKVWFEVAFEDCPTWILKIIATADADLYLLCQTDLPWQSDALREYPDLKMRQRLFKMYKDCMVNSGKAWTEISGADNARTEMAIQKIDSLFQF